MNTSDLVSIGGCHGKDYNMTFYMLKDHPYWLIDLGLWIESCKKRLDELLKYPDKLNKIMLLCGNVNDISGWPPLFISVSIKSINDHIDVEERDFDYWI